MALSQKELRGMMSSQEYEWETPPKLFNYLDSIFHFGLDAAATPKNALCDTFWTPKENALVQHWCKHGNVFCNPPYGRDVDQWVWQGYSESSRCKRHPAIIMLLAARTETKWFQEIVFRHALLICFLNQRVRFIHPTREADSPAFPSVVAVFYSGTSTKAGDHLRWKRMLNALGHTIIP